MLVGYKNVKRRFNLSVWSLGVSVSLLSGALACSPANHLTESETLERESPAVDNRATEPVQRYVISVDPGEDSAELRKNVDTVVESLTDAGALQVDPLKGQRTIFVTCKQSAIDQAMKSGLIESVQEDRLRKPSR